MATDRAMGAWVAEHIRDRNAFEFLSAVYRIIELWDDLIDGDRTPVPDEINRAFYAALVTLPANPFYRAHGDVLGGAVLSCILAWHTANALHGRSPEHDAQAYTLRKQFINLVALSATLLGGVELGQLASDAGWMASAIDDPLDHFTREGV